MGCLFGFRFSAIFTRGSQSLAALAVLLSTLIPADALAANVRLQWNPNSESDVSGYRVYFGTSSGSYSQSVNVGKVLDYTLSGLSAGQNYYFVATATNVSGIESIYSSAVSIAIPALPTPTLTPTPAPTPPPVPQLDTDGDGISDLLDSDDDNDGLSDAEELIRHTDPLRADSDLDGISDGVEVANGSDPLDAASGSKPFIQQSCTQWDGSFGGMWNVAEIANIAPAAIHGAADLLASSGQSASKTALSIPALRELDLAVHMLPGYQLGSSGAICLKHDGEANDVLGQLLLYKPVSAANVSLGKKYDFALALDLNAGRAGVQYVGFDMTQLSTAAADAADMVANWIQVVNLGTAAFSGKLRFYNSAGALLGEKAIQVGPKQRSVTGAHLYGPNQKGFAEWIPDTAGALAAVRNITYLYDNPGTVSSFSGGYAREARAPGSLLAIPVTTELSQTALAEVSNVLTSSVNVTINAYDTNGRSLMTTARYTLKPKATQQLLLSRVKNRKAMVLIKSDKAGSLIGGVRQYARSSTGAVLYIYSLNGTSPAGSLFEAVYDTHDSQQSTVLFANPTSYSRKVLVSLRRSNGQAAVTPFWVTIPKYAVRYYNVTDPDSKGVVTIQPDQANSIVSWLTRRRNNDYVVPLLFQPE